MADNSNLGKGEPLIGFCPYFRHEYSSGGISAILELIAGTRIILFTRDFLKSVTRRLDKKVGILITCAGQGGPDRARRKEGSFCVTFSLSNGSDRRKRRTCRRQPRSGRGLDISSWRTRAAASPRRPQGRPEGAGMSPACRWRRCRRR